MALQGTLETFALPDVLRLLASTHKTGRLRLTGSQGSGSLWLDGGAIVGSEAARVPLAEGPTDVLFELMRFKEGDFVFDDDAATHEPGTPTEVEDALTAAEAMLEEWKSIEAVVPSLAGWVSLRAELPENEVTVDAAHWRQLVAVGGGTTVAGLGDQLGMGELPISRAVKDLIELGLVELGDAPSGAFEAPVAAFDTSMGDDGAVGAFADSTPGISFDGVGAGSDAPLLTVVSDPVSDPLDDANRFDPGALVIEEPAVADEAVASDEDDMADAAEIARQLANLSPKAAKAVAAAAKATTSEEREAALAEVDETEDPINRGLLLKFLGSVNG